MIHDADLAEAAEHMMLMGDGFIDGRENLGAFAQELEYPQNEQMTFAQEYSGGDDLRYEDMGYDDMDYQQMEFTAEEEASEYDGYLGNEIEFEIEGIRGL